MNTSQHDGSRRTAYQAGWTQRQERGNMTMLRLMTWLSLHLGRAFARIILPGISLYFLLFSPTSRAASRAYLGRVFGRKPTITELFRHIYCFASTIHDRVFLLGERFDLFQIDLEGIDVLDNVIAAGRGALLMGAHMGSFEVLRAVGGQQPGLKVGMVAYKENARKINAVLAAINPSAVQDIIPLGQIDSMLQVQACLDNGMVLGMLADRTLGGEPSISLRFLGENAKFPTGPMRLAAILRRPVLFMTGLYLGSNHYVIHFEKLADFTDVECTHRNAAIRSAVSAYATSLERHCRAAPNNWFNFFDFWQSKNLK